MAYRIDAGIARSLDMPAGSDDLAVTYRVDSDTPVQRHAAAGAPAAHVMPDFAIQTASPFAHSGFQIGGIDDGAGTNTPGVGGDDIPDDNSSTVSLNVQEGQSVTSSIDDPTDQDWFVTQMTGGQAYDINLRPTDTSSIGPDFKIDIYDADGNLITEQDSGSFGASEKLTFTPDGDGTYFVAIESYAGIGEYTVSAALGTTDVNFGTPLDAIDWGGTENRVDTDGVKSANGDDVIQFYFAQTGEVYESNLAGVVVAEDWKPFEKQSVYTAFEQYDHIINTDYVEVDNAADADFVLISHAFEPNVLGSMSPPNEPYEGQAEFNNLGVGWDKDGLKQGGFGFITFIHEFGHGHGLAHPHDTGGGSTVMNGVTPDTTDPIDSSTGDFGLNAGIYTTMSYNDGWDNDGPNGPAPSNSYGYQGTLMAFDIAVLQQKYGANMTYKTGDNVYKMAGSNGPGTFYSCIWDAGGNDTIRASGAIDSTIDLRPATLQYEIGGGGFVSWGVGIFGGFTIAHGVVIENAIGARGNDIIMGNDADNLLKGRLHNDALFGGKGEDRIVGGRGADTMTGGHGDDTFVFGNHSTLHTVHADVITDLHRGDVIDLSQLDADSGTSGDQSFTHVDQFHGVAGELVVKFNESMGATLVLMDTDGNGHSDHVIILSHNHAGYDHFVL